MQFSVMPYLISLTLGYGVAHFFSAREVGQPGRISSVIRLPKKWVFHFHHWIFGAIVLAYLLSEGIHSMFLLGFFTGLVLQGLTYRDFYRVLYRKA